MLGFGILTEMEKYNLNTFAFLILQISLFLFSFESNSALLVFLSHQRGGLGGGQLKRSQEIFCYARSRQKLQRQIYVSVSWILKLYNRII